MIPLVRPVLPELHELMPYYQISKKSNQWSNFGPVYDLAVQKLNQTTGRYCLPVANGTIAIQIALQEKFSPGDCIAIPDFTHVGTLNAVIQAGMKPILFPVDKSTWTISLKELQNHHKRIDGVVVVSPFGYSVDFERYNEFSAKYGIDIVYDLAGGWGMPTHHARGIVCFSLHATKNFSCGEGGLVCFETQGDYEAARKSINFYTLPDRTIANSDGGNWKIDEIKAGIICAHLENHERILNRIERKRNAIDFYMAALGDKVLQHTIHSTYYAAPSLCVLGGVPADSLESNSKHLGATFKKYYLLLSDMMGLHDVRRVGASHKFFRSCCAFPSDCTDEELDKIVDALQTYL
jgi:dTDP-4-amino-4,6-dideoxygalactose transaminase